LQIIFKKLKDVTEKESVNWNILGIKVFLLQHFYIKEG